MTSHIVLPRLDPDRPATTSRRILTDLLRDELGFDGVIVTDALDMAGASAGIGIPEAAVRSLAAGADLLCLGTDSEPILDAVLDAIVAAVEQGELPIDRLRDAAARVGALARLEPTDEGFPRPEVALGSAFDVQPDAAEALRQSEGWTVVTLDTEPNIAVGAGAWGPAAALTADPNSAAALRFASWRAVSVPVDREARVPEVDGPVLVLGRDLHRRPHARAAVDALRAAGGPVVVVDLGWPSPDRRYADIATFGASRAVGAALLALLTGTEEPAWRS